MMIAAPPSSPSSSPIAEKMKSVATNGMRVGQAHAEPDAGQPAGGEREQRLHELVALAGGVGERVQPDVDARADVAEQRSRPPSRRRRTARARRRRRRRGRWRCRASRGRSRRRAASEPRSRSNDEDEQRDDPHEQQRAERARLGQRMPRNAAGRDREHLAVLGEVGGEEEHDEDLGDLARLERQPPMRIHSLAPLISRPMNAGQQQQHEAGDHERVLVAREALERRHRDRASATSAATPMKSHTTWLAASLGSSRVTIASPMPESTKVIGSSPGSAPGAKRRTARCASRNASSSAPGTKRLATSSVLRRCASTEREDQQHRRGGREQEEQLCGAAGSHRRVPREPAARRRGRRWRARRRRALSSAMVWR